MEKIVRGVYITTDLYVLISRSSTRCFAPLWTWLMSTSSITVLQVDIFAYFKSTAHLTTSNTGRRYVRRWSILNLYFLLCHLHPPVVKYNQKNVPVPVPIEQMLRDRSFFSCQFLSFSSLFLVCYSFYLLCLYFSPFFSFLFRWKSFCVYQYTNALF